MGSPSASATAATHRGKISQRELDRRETIAANALRHAVEREATRFMSTRYEQLNPKKVTADLDRAANGRMSVGDFAKLVRDYFVMKYEAHIKYRDWFDGNIMSQF